MIHFNETLCSIIINEIFEHIPNRIVSQGVSVPVVEKWQEDGWMMLHKH